MGSASLRSRLGCGVRKESCGDVTYHFRRKRFRMLRVDLPKICLLVGLAAAGWAQPAPPAREIPLYSGVAPGSENWSYAERAAGTPDKPQAQNIVRPVLLYYPAEKATAVETAMIVAPGGGFRTLMMSYEGVDVAKRMNQMGVDAF